MRFQIHAERELTRFMSENLEKRAHVDKIRLIAATTSKFELEIAELRHIFKCGECRHLFRDFGDPFRPRKRKALTQAA